jgi:hypothetical protein
VVIKAGALNGFSREGLSAGDEPESAMQEPKGISHGESTAKGSEATSCIPFGVSGEEDAGKGFFGDDDIGIAFVVPQADVIGGAMFFNEVAF